MESARSPEGTADLANGKPQPIAAVIKVDYALHGCPIDRAEFIRASMKEVYIALFVSISLVLIVMNVCAWLGLHPIILVSVLGPWLLPIQPDQTMLAMTFLMSWGIGLTACPMSNTMLAMAGRYGLPFGELLGQNRRYSIKMTAVCIAVLHGYAAVAGTA